jgi:hypothetical protein
VGSAPRGVLGGSRVRADSRNIETLTNSQPAGPDVDSAPNWLPGGVGGGWAVSEAMEAFVTSLAGVRGDGYGPARVYLSNEQPIIVRVRAKTFE